MTINQPELRPIEWRNGSLRIQDQTALPAVERYVEISSFREVVHAIQRLSVRGAPLIGIAGAYAVALAANEDGVDVRQAAAEISAARPTAINLRWAVERTLAAADPLAEAHCIHTEQIESDRRCGEFGSALIDDGATVLTHCNTGSLATGGIGTALGVIKTAHAQGKRISVLVDETRPLLQGSRLTAWELARGGITHNVIVDAAAAGIIARGAVQAIFVGADRIAANGDAANKLGTYGLALAAQTHDVPFYVVAPLSTIDAATANGASIAIEERDGDEVLSFAGSGVAPQGTTALNPAFDVTPARLITAIVTERGVLRPPFPGSIAGALRQAVPA